MRTSERTENIFKALSEFQKEVENPEKKATAKIHTEKGDYSYNYSTLPDTLNVVRPKLTKHGLSVTQDTLNVDGGIGIETLIAHSTGEWILYGPLSLTPDKPGPQAAGSVITYGRRYQLAAALGIASEEDDDANVAESEAEKKEEAKKPERTPGGATVKSYNFARSLFIQRGLCLKGKRSESEDEAQERRDANKLAVVEWLSNREFESEGEDPLYHFNAETISNVIDTLQDEIKELESE